MFVSGPMRTRYDIAALLALGCAVQLASAYMLLISRRFAAEFDLGRLEAPSWVRLARTAALSVVAVFVLYEVALDVLHLVQL